MEETKLLRLLVLTMTSLLLFKPCVYGDEPDMEWAQSLAADNQRIFMDNLKEMMEMSGFDENLKAEVLKPRPRLQIFVSSSMPIGLLKSYAKEAVKYNGVLVFRGLPAGVFIGSPSWSVIYREIMPRV